jgi:hypothetical protein
MLMASLASSLPQFHLQPVVEEFRLAQSVTEVRTDIKI